MTVPGQGQPATPGWPGPSAPQPSGPSGSVEDPHVIELKHDPNAGVMIKCPRCGSSDIHYSIEATALVCSNCRTQYNEEILESQVDLTSGIRELRGTVVTELAQNLIDAETVTLKCRACGAEVVINANEGVQVRCHWCRNYLSMDSRIRNGAVPDAVAPFQVPREQAIEKIRSFVEARKFFAHPRFKREFQPENVVGVYLPYFVFDGMASAHVWGEGEIQTRRWTEKSGDSTVTYYSADVYQVGRAFDMEIDDLLLESSSERGNLSDPSQTNNIINAILPFHVKGARRYNPNYLRGFTSERRDINVDQMGFVVRDRLLSIARARADEMTTRYNRRVRWDGEEVDLHGSRWATVYLPVWLYSYYQQSKGLKHFVAVNGQNANVMGSVPVNMVALLLVTLLVMVVGTVIGLMIFLGMG